MHVLSIFILRQNRMYKSNPSSKYDWNFIEISQLFTEKRHKFGSHFDCRFHFGRAYAHPRSSSRQVIFPEISRKFLTDQVTAAVVEGGGRVAINSVIFGGKRMCRHIVLPDGRYTSIWEGDEFSGIFCIYTNQAWSLLQYCRRKILRK